MADTAYFNTGARTSLVSPELYKILRQQGINFNDTEIMFTQADGNSQRIIVQAADVPITLKEKTVTTNIFFIPTTPKAKILLDIDYAKKTGMTESHHQSYGLVTKA